MDRNDQISGGHSGAPRKRRARNP